MSIHLDLYLTIQVVVVVVVLIQDSQHYLAIAVQMMVVDMGQE